MLAEQLSHSTSATRRPEPGQPHHSAEPSNQNVPLKHLAASHSMLRQTVSIVSRLKFRKTLAFMLRSSLSPRLTLRWLRFLGEYTEQHTFAPPHDDLIRKSLSSFLVHRMAWKTRFNILTQHFELARQLLCPHVLQALWRGEKIELGTICGRERAYHLNCCFPIIAAVGTKARLRCAWWTRQMTHFSAWRASCSCVVRANHTV